MSGSAPDRSGNARPVRPKRLLDRFWATLGEQLRQPSGRSGAIVGTLMAALNAKPYRLTIEALELQAGDRVLDLGFGPGRSLAALVAKTQQGRIHGIDHSALMLRRALRKHQAAIASGRMQLVQGTFSALPWRDGAFDKILLVNVVYFFDLHGRDMSEAYRVLRAGGRLAVYATDRATMAAWPFSGPDTHKTFDAADLTDLLVKGGFDRSRVHIRTVALPFAIRGIVATAEKKAAPLG